MGKLYTATMEEQEIEALGLDGFRSGVWADGARMEALVGSADAWKTSQAAYYLLLWCRENGVDPSEQLDVGDEIFVPHAEYGDIPCILIGKGIDGTGSLTFITREIVCQRCFDAPEPTNPNASRRNSGSSRYSQSNILQWLNSAKPAGGQWYKAQHEYDAPPDGTNVSVNAYDTEAGFLCGFDLHFLNALQPVSKVTALNTVTDGGGSETVRTFQTVGGTGTQKMFLPSYTELGRSVSNVVEGTAYPYFTDEASRKASFSDYALSHTEFSDAASDLNDKRTGALWVTRSANPQYTYSMRVVGWNGDLGGRQANLPSLGIRPAFVL